MLKIPRKKTMEEKPEKKLAIVLPLNTKHRGLDYIIELVKKIRPAKHRNIAKQRRRFQAVLYQLQQDKSALFTLRKALLSQFTDSNLIMALTESGITRSRGFVQELMQRT
jgi:site-specific recombinase